MSAEFDPIREKFQQNPPPPPRPEAKAQALLRARQAFEEKNAEARQGFTLRCRLKDIIVQKGGRLMRKSYYLAGGLSVGLLALVLWKTDYLSKPQVYQTAENMQQSPTASVPDLGKKEGGKGKDEDQLPNVTPTPLPEVAQTEVHAQYNGALASRGAEAPKPSLSLNRKSFFGDAAGAPAGRLKISSMPSDQPVTGYYYEEGRDKFEKIQTNSIKLTQQEPVSTFSIDVDTASYSFVRASLNQNILPQKDAVRIEELVNYFPYDYAAPENKNEPFKSNVAVFPTPWNPNTKLLHIGIKGYELTGAQKPRSNLVFLIDTSGSMNAPNKLPLLVNSFKLLVDTLGAEDRVAIVTYAGSAGTVLEPTLVKEKTKILDALNRLGAGGSTAGAEGIRQAYQLAELNFDKAAINRVILATDGDFNVGITSTDELKSFVERKRQTGVYLSVLGFGTGNYNDQLMQTLAQNGNGNAAYIDNLNEARKALVEEASSTLFPIAKDVKIQVEFNPAQIAEYRLIGYETRMLKREDFNNDKIDAGDIGAGHTVTALYEITPVGSASRLIDDSRYQAPAPTAPVEAKSQEYAFVKIRYKLPTSDTSQLITTPVDAKSEYKEASAVPNEARFATAVAAFGQLLRGDAYTKNFSYDDLLKLAEGAKGADRFGYRAEFLNLVRLAKSAPALKTLGR